MAHNLNKFVVLASLVRLKVMRKATRVLGNLSSLGSIQVIRHSLVEGEERSSRSNLGTHVTNSTHSSARQRFNTRSVVFNDGTSTTFDSQYTGNLKDDIYEGVSIRSQ